MLLGQPPAPVAPEVPVALPAGVMGVGGVEPLVGGALLLDGGGEPPAEGGVPPAVLLVGGVAGGGGGGGGEVPLLVSLAGGVAGAGGGDPVGGGTFVVAGGCEVSVVLPALEPPMLAPAVLPGGAGLMRLPLATTPGMLMFERSLAGTLFSQDMSIAKPFSLASSGASARAARAGTGFRGMKGLAEEREERAASRETRT